MADAPSRSRRPHDALPHPRRHRQGRRRRDASPSTGRDPRRRRRVGFGQVGDGAHHHAAHPDAARQGRGAATSLFKGRVAAHHEGRRSMRKIRGNDIAMIFQDPMTSLNPVYRDRQPDRRAAHAAQGHVARRRRWARAVELLELVGIPQAEERAQGLPAPVLGRHAPARDDRDGALLRPGHPDRRRADHRARRDHPGADPRAHAGAPGAHRASRSS